MAKKYKNDFKVMLVELLKSGRKAKSLSEEYNTLKNLDHCLS